MNRSFRLSWLGVLLPALGATLASCGGDGVGSGGTGAPVSVSSATVNGFGSVVADGSVYGTDGATVREETRPGVFSDTVLELGQGLTLRYHGPEGAEQAIRVDVEPALVGAVSAAPSAGTFTVRSQTVRINTDPDQGPVTFFEGFHGLSGLSAGEQVRVYGVLRRNGSSQEIRASRIEKLPGAPAADRVMGVVSALDTTGGALRFALGSLLVDATQATVLDGPVANGLRVAVWFSPGTDQVQGVRVLRLNEPGSISTPGRIGGVVGQLDEFAQTFELAGVLVRYAGAQVTPQGPQFQLGDGVFVRVRGSHLQDGSFLATRVQVRKRADPGFVEVELTGPVEEWSSLGRFQVRGTPVNAQGAGFRGNCGPSTPPLTVGQRVRIEGGVQTGVQGSYVQAAIVHCLNTP